VFDPDRLAKVLEDIQITNNQLFEPNRAPATLWYVIDESRAEPEVGYPGDIISTHTSLLAAKIGRAEAIIRLSAEWFPVAVRPPEKKLVMVTGPSGYANHKTFLALAYYDNKYRPPLADGEIRWLDVCNAALMDQSWIPTHWAHPIVLPTVA
jgi:hypothetical protein